MEPVAVMDDAEQPFGGFGAMPQLQQREWTFRRVLEQSSIANRDAGKKIGRQLSRAAMPDLTTRLDKVVATIGWLAADNLVDGMQQQQGYYPGTYQQGYAYQPSRNGY